GHLEPDRPGDFLNRAPRVAVHQRLAASVRYGKRRALVLVGRTFCLPTRSGLGDTTEPRNNVGGVHRVEVMRHFMRWISAACSGRLRESQEGFNFTMKPRALSC